MELAFLQSEISVLSPSIRAKKKQKTSFKISCSAVPPVGGKLFCCLKSYLHIKYGSNRFWCIFVNFMACTGDNLQSCMGK